MFTSRLRSPFPHSYYYYDYYHHDSSAAAAAELPITFFSSKKAECTPSDHGHIQLECMYPPAVPPGRWLRTEFLHLNACHSPYPRFLSPDRG